MIVGQVRSPGEMVPILLADRDDRTFGTCARWGWRRADGRLSPHARFETAPNHPLWRDACGIRRAAVAVIGWVDGDGWRYSASNGMLILFLAGLWRRDDAGLAIALLDQPAQTPFAEGGGERMPIAMELDLAVNWITGLPMGRARSRQFTGIVAQPPAA